MKHIIRLIWFLLILNFSLLINDNPAKSQSLSVFDIDVHSFPKIRASFYAFDSTGKQIRNLSAADFSIIESGNNMPILSVSCPDERPPREISSVLVIDASGSMAEPPIYNINLAKAASHTWVESLPSTKWECGITSFSNSSYIEQNFTNDKNLLYEAIDYLRGSGGTNYNAAFYSMPKSAINLANQGKYKKVIIFLTDGFPNYEPQTQFIIDELLKDNITVYTVTLNMECPTCLKDISTASGGQWFEFVNSKEDAEIIYRTILKLSQDIEPCTIEWMGTDNCRNFLKEAEIKLNPLNVSANISYIYNDYHSFRLEFNPAAMSLSDIEPGKTKDTVISVTARNASVKILDITSNNPNFDINPKKFDLLQDETKQLKIHFRRVDLYNAFVSFDFITDDCILNYNVSAPYTGMRGRDKSILLTRPNGREVFLVGSDTTINWVGCKRTDSISLAYSIDSGATWQRITKTATGFEQFWRKIPNTVSNRCLMKAKLIEDPKTSSTMLAGHLKRINNSEFSPDGRRVLTCSDDSTAIIWDASTGEIVVKLTGNKAGVENAHYSPDSKKILTCCPNSQSLDSQTVKIRDAMNGKELYSIIGLRAGVLNAKFSPDGTKFFTLGKDGTVIICDVITGNQLQVLNHPSIVIDAEFSPDGKKIVTIYGNTAQVWDVNSGNRVQNLAGHTSKVNSAHYSSDGSKIVTASDDCSAIIWNLKTGQILFKLSGHQSQVNDAKFTPDCKKVITGSKDNKAIIWDAITGNSLDTLIGHHNEITNLEISSTGKRILTAGNDDYAITWDLNTCTKTNVLNEPGGGSPKAKFSPDGERVLTNHFNKNYANVWYSDTVSYQDESDTLWSIVKPDIKSRDIDMGKVLLGKQKDSVVVDYIINRGTCPITFNRIDITGPDRFDFALVYVSYPFKVDIGKKAAIRFRFRPSSKGIKTAMIKIISQTDTLIQYIQGEGIAPQVKVIGSIIDFGKVQVGKFKDTLSVATIKNIGADTLYVNSTSFGNPNDIDFSTIDGNAPFDLAPGDKAKMGFKFKPSIVGRTKETLIFEHSGFESPTAIQLIGEGITPSPKIEATNRKIPVLICKSTMLDTIIIKNIGGKDLLVEWADITGANKDDFTFDTPFSAMVINPDSIKSIIIKFAPMNTGLREAELVFKCNSIPDSIYSVQLTGQKERIDIIPAQPVIDLGTILINTPVNISFDIMNKGTISTGAFAVVPTGFSLDRNEFVIDTGSMISLALHFNGSPYDAVINQQIVIIDSICGYSITLPILAKVISTSNIKVSANSISNLICESFNRDTVTITNGGGKKITINDAYFDGQNKDEFSLYEPFSPIEIQPDSSRNLIIKFCPQGIGLKTADLLLKTDAKPDSIITFHIETRKDSIGLKLSPDYNSGLLTDSLTIDLGKILLNQIRDTSFVIQNTGTIPTGLYLNSSNDISVTANYLFLNQSQSQKINVHFPGRAISVPINVQITIRDTVCNKELIVKIIGEILRPGAAILQVGSAQGYPGDIIEVPIYLRNPMDVIQSGTTEFKADLSFNSTLLEPLDYPKSLINNGIRTVNLTFPATPTKDDILTKIKFIVGLGNAEETNLSIYNPIAIGGIMSLDTIGGKFTLLGICREGGNRLMNPKTGQELLLVSPNPSNETIGIELNLYESGRTKLSLCNLYGEIIQVFFDKDIDNFGEQNIIFNTSKLPSGVYFIQLQTPSEKISERIDVLK